MCLMLIGQHDLTLIGIERVHAGYSEYARG